MLDTQWDHEVDLLVVGSGNGAMTGAVCAHDMGVGEVLVIEKSDHFGGTSALSGGGVWVPGNRYAREAGAQDSYEEALSYLEHSVSKKLVPKEMLATYLHNAPKMIDFLHQRTRVRYRSLAKYPDYFSDRPGAKTGHRSMEPEPINITELEEDVDKLLPNGTMYMLYKYAITQAEAHLLIGRLKGWLWLMSKIIFKHYIDLPWLIKGYRFSRRTTGGGAGIIRLRLSMKDRNIPLWLNTTLSQLITEKGRITGIIAYRNGKEIKIRARKGVLLAAGGFEHNQKMREQYLPKPTSTQWSAGCRSNTGDAIRAGQAIGADSALMENAWWCTTKSIPGVEYPYLNIISKSLPGSIVVNKAGQRFSNESQNYMSFLKESFGKHSDENPCFPCYMIFDSDFRKKRSVWPALIPDLFLPRRYYDEGFMAKGNTIQELAEKMGIDADGLQDTINKFNEFAKTGKDLEFQRGDAAYDRYYGDPDVKPNPCLGAISRPPFLAITIQPGDFGTQGGLVINSNAQVLCTQGKSIPGLYACGNSTAAILPSYPGPGSTLGPAMTFAYQAAKHLSGFKD
jgi:3-oxosteroid 1-dehydrogenase